MAFFRNNTAYTGETLCASCVFGLPIGYDKSRPKGTNGQCNVYYCLRDKTEVTNVGVCKYYEDIEK